MRGRIIKDWNAVDWTRKDHMAQVRGALQHFMGLPDKDDHIRAALQQFVVKGDFPAEVIRTIEKLHDTPNYDLGYENLFDIRDFTGTNESGFDLANVTSGIVFDQVRPGEKAKVYQASGTTIRVLFARYGAGLLWDRTLIEDKQWWVLEDNAIAMTSAFYQTRAQTYYDLLDAVGAGQNIAWQPPDPALLPNTDAAWTAARDAATISLACQTIMVNLANTALAPTLQDEFRISAPIQLRTRILKALDYMSQRVAGSVREVAFNVVPQFTMMQANPATYYVVLPKRRMRGGYRQGLTLLSSEDILAYADTMAGWGRWGGAIGNVQQIHRCATV